MKRIIIFFYAIVVAFYTLSCKDSIISNKDKKNNSINYTQKEIELPTGHTFFRTRVSDKDTIIYHPCDASIAKYTLYKDSIFHNWGQEYYMFNITSSTIENSQIKLKTTYKYNNEIPDVADSSIIFKQLDKKFWKINGEIFIDSLYSNSIKHINQPCKECDNCEDKDIPKDILQITDIFVINKQWSNHCEQGVDKDNIIFYSSDEIAFGISSINFICGAISKQTDSNTIQIYLKDSGHEYAPNGEVYSNNNLPKGIDFITCSLTVPIAEVRLINKTNAEFKWLGFYNKKTKKREFIENPFTKKIEKSSIILKKCE